VDEPWETFPVQGKKTPRKAASARRREIEQKGRTGRITRTGQDADAKKRSASNHIPRGDAVAKTEN